MPSAFQPGVDYAGSDRTLVLFLSTHCKYCLGGSSGRHLVAVFPQTADREKLEIDTVAETQLGEYGPLVGAVEDKVQQAIAPALLAG